MLEQNKVDSFCVEVLRPALDEVLPVIEIPPSAAAERMLLAIGQQESLLHYRHQVLSGGRKGPARGLWQFERGGGVVGVMTHKSSANRARALADARGLSFDSYVLWAAIEYDDALATGFARLLLWTDPRPLPEAQELNLAWQYYLRNWRPGKPHPDVWPDNWQRSVVAVSVVPETPSSAMN